MIEGGIQQSVDLWGMGWVSYGSDLGLIPKSRF